MRWDQEGWRKLYTRDTATWAAMGYEGQACLLMYLRTCEPDGTIAGTPAAIARFWRWPDAIVSAGLAELVALGTIRAIERGFELPKFAEAQQARTTSAERSRRKRAADRAAGNGKAPHNAGTRGDAEGRAGTLRDDKIRQEKRREEKNTATPRAPVIQRGAYRAAWHDVRLLLVELEKPLQRAVSWPVTEPPHFLEALRSMGGEKPLCEALRALQGSIISGHIPAERWHRRMFSPGSVEGWQALLDEHRTREQARAARDEVEMQRIEQANKPDTEPEYDDEAFSKIFEVVQ